MNIPLNNFKDFPSQIKNWLLIMKNNRSLWLVLFIICIGLLWLILFEWMTYEKIEKQIGFFIGAAGLLFSFVQFQIQLINRKKNFYRDIRYAEYKRLQELCNSYIDYISEAIWFKKDLTILTLRLMAISNEINNILKVNNEKIFVGILNKEVSRELNENKKKILEVTNEFRKEYERLDKMDKSEQISGFKDAMYLGWNDEISEHFKGFVKNKTYFLRELQKYIWD